MEKTIENKNYCVYVHTSPSGKKYVGQTCQKPEDRWGNNGIKYLSKRKGIYQHPAFANAILKYGWENFDHEIVASNLTKEESNSFEVLLIEKLNTMNPQYGYNCTSGGSNGRPSEETKKRQSESHKGANHHMYGSHLSEETKKKISDAHKGKVVSEATRNKIGEANRGRIHSEETLKKMSASHKGKKLSKKIAQYNSQGYLIKIWDCIDDAKRALNINNNGISECCRGMQKKAGGFIWRYADQELTEEYLAWCNELHTGENQKKLVAQYSLDNKFICLFNSITEASIKTGVNTGSISACCREKQKTAGGFIWKYYESEDINKFSNIKTEVI